MRLEALAASHHSWGALAVGPYSCSVFASAFELDILRSAGAHPSIFECLERGEWSQAMVHIRCRRFSSPPSGLMCGNIRIIDEFVAELVPEIDLGVEL